MLKANINIFAPRIVAISTFYPKKNTNTDIDIACVKAPLKENITPSSGCVLKTLIGVRHVAEWWTLCKAHNTGHLCINL